jgi:hypothetical protein
MKENAEFDKFDSMMHRIIKVPHEKIKAKLDAEKAAKQKRVRKVRDNERKTQKG